MKPLLALALPALLFVSACSEQEMCVYQNTSDLRAAQSRVSELETNIRRGYAVHRTTERVTRPGVCYRKNGKPYECLKTEWERVERPVPINVADQRRQLRALQIQLPALQRDASLVNAQCRQAHPE